MQLFKKTLRDKLRATHERATEDPAYSTFLKQFGYFKTATLEEEELPAFKFLLDAIQELRREFKHIVVRSANSDGRLPLPLSSVDAVRLMEDVYSLLPAQSFQMDGDTDLPTKCLEIAEMLRAMLIQDKAMIPLSTVLEFVTQKLQNANVHA
jgi:hypothetical protein